MDRRKRIGLITIAPERDYQKRLISGIMQQCQRYNYDVFMFSSMVQISSYFKDYLHAELNIYELINFDLLDAVIITPVPMMEDNEQDLYNHLLDKIQKECKKPVISIDYAFGDYDTVYTDDFTALYQITEHLITEHGCKTFSVLTGQKDYAGSITRLNGVKAALQTYNLTLDDKDVFYGDFWYPSGEELAEKYVGCELKLPDAIICTSDHMAIGVVNCLIKNGIKVPQDVIVTGYGADRQASLNNPPITSYQPDFSYTGILAVNKIHTVLENTKDVIQIDLAGKENICMGATCGCKEDVEYTREKFKSSEMNLSHDFSERNFWDTIDMGVLLESYMSEMLTSARTPLECFRKIYDTKYLLKPYESLFLCLNENWLNSDYDIKDGYPEKMRLVLYNNKDDDDKESDKHLLLGYEKEYLFDSKQMIPDKEYFVEANEPCLYSFIPLHFNDISLGYVIMRNYLSSNFIINAVYRNYMRNINNALEMIRAKNKIAFLSEHDMMTGLFNRRGMEDYLNHISISEVKDKKFLAILIDMDGLKHINDTYGHSSGDAAIIKIGKSLEKVTSMDEICVRGGGDEFYLLGIGDYTQEIVQEKIKKFNSYLKNTNDYSELNGITLTASVGFSISDIADEMNYNDALEKADIQMYLQKRAKKNKR